MNFRTTAALFGLLFGLLWLFGLMLSLKPGYQDMGFVFPGLNESTDAAVDAVEIERITPAKDRERFLFAKAPDGWTLKIPGQNETIRVEGDKVEQIIRELREARKNDEATEVFNDPARYGLDQPAAEVTLKDQAKNKEWKLAVGKESPDKNYYYVSSSERPGQVMAVRSSSVSPVLFKSVNELRSRKLLDVTDTNTSFVDLKGKKDGKAEEVTLKKTEEGDWVFVTPPYGAAEPGSAALGVTPDAKQEPGVRGLLSAVGALRVESENDFEPPGKKLAEFGLEAGREKLRITAEYSEGFGGFGGKKAAKHSLLIGDKVGDKYYARLDGDNTVVRLDAKKLEPIFQVLHDPRALRSRDLAKVDPHAPDAIDIRHGKGLAEVVKLRRPEPTLWDLLVDKEPVRKANLSAVEGDKGLLETLRGKKQVKEFFDLKETDPAKRKEEEAKLDARLGLTGPTAQVAIYVKGLEKPAKADKEKEKDKGKADEKKGLELKKDAKPALTLTFGKTEGGQVYVKREEGDSVSRVAVPADILAKVLPPEGWLAFLDPSLSPFTAEDATKLKLVRSDGTFEADKDAKKDEWTLAVAGEKGAKKADAGQVHDVLHKLAALSVKKWVKRTADKKELEGYGLAKPALTAEVTVKKKDDAKPTTYTYEFGKESETDKPAVYARQGGSDLVFLAAEGDSKALQNAELRDRTVYDFDPTKVKEIQLTIRKQGDPTLKPVFERGKSPGSWVIKSGLEEFQLDNLRVEEFARLLSKLQAERYVSFKGPSPEQNLAVDKAALVVRVVLDDGKATHTLTVGAKDKEGDYYATADTHPNTVFLLSRGRFDPVMTGVSYFGKR